MSSRRSVAHARATSGTATSRRPRPGVGGGAARWVRSRTSACDAERRGVVREGPGGRFLGAEAVEAELQGRVPHLLAEAVALVFATQPGAGLERPCDRELGGHDARRADDGVADEHGEDQVPLGRRRVGATAPPEAIRLPLELRRLVVGPRHGERHRGRVVDPPDDERGELGGERVVDVPQCQAGRANLEIEERPVRVWHRPSVVRAVRVAKRVSPSTVVAVGFTRAELESYRDATVDDLVGPGLRLLFVGINPGLWTAATGTHFAHPGNRFYPALLRAGVIERQIDRGAGMDAADREHLVGRGIGITNLVARATARAAELRRPSCTLAGSGSWRSSSATSPSWSPSPASPPTAPRSAPKAVLGRQPESFAGAELWIVPNPSGLNAHETIDTLAAAYRAQLSPPALSSCNARISRDHAAESATKLQRNDVQ